jgi:hypothetical protein
MRLAKLVTACGLLAFLVAACGGIKPKPLAGTPRLESASGNHAAVDDPRLRHAKCLRQDHFRITEYRTSVGNLPAIQVGSLPSGPTIVFEPTPGIAEGLQIKGQDEGAEVISAALLFPNGASDRELNKVETCVALGVIG